MGLRAAWEGADLGALDPNRLMRIGENICAAAWLASAGTETADEEIPVDTGEKETHEEASGGWGSTSLFGGTEAGSPLR
jgi:hypothetical protein